MPSELKPTTREERERWKANIGGQRFFRTINPSDALRLIADVDRQQEYISFLWSCCLSGEIPGPEIMEKIKRGEALNAD